MVHEGVVDLPDLSKYDTHFYHSKYLFKTDCALYFHVVYYILYVTKAEVTEVTMCKYMQSQLLKGIWREERYICMHSGIHILCFLI
jgi:hypothetical protein